MDWNTKPTTTSADNIGQVRAERVNKGPN